MARTFSAQVRGHVAKYKRQQEFIIKASAQDMAELVNLPGPSVARPDAGKGGLLPVDLAFLQNSFAGNIGDMPTGPTQPEEGVPEDWSGAITLVINNSSPGDVLSFGWTAAYAAKMEELYGYRRQNLMRWQSVVDANVRRAKAIR